MFLDCRLCFYKVMALGKKRPEIDADNFALNNTVDALWKKEFDLYRAGQIPHPIMQANNIKAVPCNHAIVHIWRDFKQGGIRYSDTQRSLDLCGVIDDLWVTEDSQFVLVDYKTTSKNNALTPSMRTNRWAIRNQRQMDFYAYLLSKKNLPVHNVSYFIYSTAINDRPAFNQILRFSSEIQPYQHDYGWVDDTIRDIATCLKQTSLPEPSVDCAYCNFSL